MNRFGCNNTSLIRRSENLEVENTSSFGMDATNPFVNSNPQQQQQQNYSCDNYYLTVLIIDLICGIVASLYYGIFLILELSKGISLEWFLVLLFVVLLINFIAFEYFGWRGYLYHETKSVLIFTIYRTVIAVVAAFRMYKAISVGPEKVVTEFFLFMLTIAMAYIPFLFLQELK